jgi:predicted kinase
MSAAPPPPLPIHFFVRGPPAAGKSTACAALARRLRAGGLRVCVLEEDLFRYGIPLGAAGGGGASKTHGVAAAMLRGAALGALAEGYSVVVEGLLNADRYGGTGLFAPVADARARIAFLRAAVATSQARHAGRAKAAEFGAEEVAAWHPRSVPLGCADELVLDVDGASLEEVVLALERRCSS